MTDEVDINQSSSDPQAEPETEAPEQQPEDQGADVEEEAAVEPQQPKKDKSGYARMRDSLRKVEERNDRLERMLTALIEKGSQQQPTTQQPPEDPKPAAKDFETPEDFIEAMSEWKARKIVRESLESERTQTRQTSAVERAQAAFEARRQALPTATFADYDDVIASAPPVPQDVAMAILHDPNGPRIAYALAHQPDLISRMHQMTPHQRMFELAKCAFAATPQQQKPTSSHASPPAPIAPLNTGGKKEISIDNAHGIRDIRAAMRARQK